MRGKRALSLAATMAGVGLLAAAFLVSTASSKPNASAKKGGTFNVNMAETDVDFSDPALGYFVYSWQILYPSCSMLVGWPDKPAPEGSRLVADGAASMPKISQDGKTYTFTVRKGLKFANGQTVTAANYAYSMNRDLNPDINSPATSYMHEIVGADAVLDKKAKTASGIVAKGNTLTIKLTKPRPDFLSILAMAFFCPLPTNTPATADGVNTFPGSGPYTIQSRTPNRQITMVLNKHYNGPRPHNFDRIVITMNVDLNQSLLQVKAGQADYDAAGLPPTAHADLGKQYGVNKGQYRVNPGTVTDYLNLRTDRGIFTDVNLRKAVNWAIDRPQFLRARGAFAGKRDDQLLSPLFEGYKDVKIYPIKGADVNGAKALVAKSTTCKNGCKAVIYTANAGAFATQAQIAQFNLKQIGIDVSIQQFTRSVEHTKCGTKAEQFDLCIEAWGSDYNDPVTFINPLLNGNNIVETNNNNESYFNNAKVNNQIEQASLLTGPKRYAAFNALDISTTRDFAPQANFLHRNTREFISARMDPKCYVYQPVYQALDYAAACLK
jgi:peptide/nickel transport system substrate-binding protein